MEQIIERRATVTVSLEGLRLDQGAAQLFDEFSRSRLKAWILSGELLVNGERCQPRHKLTEGDRLELKATLESDQSWQPEDIGLTVVFEDEVLLVINKPVGLVVHPAAGHRDGTLLNALLHHCPQLAQLPRAGIVHRLDKDTSGLMVVAKQLSSHANLVSQLQARSVKRSYQALARGTLVAGGTVSADLGRHPVHRKKMAVVQAHGKEAITHYRVLERFPAHTLLRLNLETGRTHQIRVHMAHIGHPLVGDPVYGGRLSLPPAADETLHRALADFRRQALHAWRLALVHPGNQRRVSWEAPLPPDMEYLLQQLRGAP